MCRQDPAVLFVLYNMLYTQQKHFINYKLGYNLGSSSLNTVLINSRGVVYMICADYCDIYNIIM